MRKARRAGSLRRCRLAEALQAHQTLAGTFSKHRLWHLGSEMKFVDKLIVLGEIFILVIPLAASSAFFGVLCLREFMRPNGEPLPPLLLSSGSLAVSLLYAFRLRKDLRRLKLGASRSYFD
jgi:hypothetical protein